MKGPDTKNQIPSRRISFFPQTPFSVLLLSLALLPPISLQAASTGNVALFTPAGSGATAAQGSYVSASGSLDTYYSYFIEVPPGVSQMYIQVFDGDIGAGGTGETTAGRDRIRGTTWNTSCRYRIYRPAGTILGTTTLDDTSSAYDNAWVSLTSANPVSNPPAGHWEVRVDMSSARTTGDDINAFGIRAHDGDPGAGGTELNVYFHSFTNIGAQQGTYSTRNYTLYPYVTSGSTGFFNDWDWDVDLGGNMGSVNLTSPSGLFTQNITPLSNNNAWRQNSFTGWCDLGATSAGLPAGSLADDYGFWTAAITVGIGTQDANYMDIYMGGFGLGAPPPTAQPQANTFRIYLPTDAGGRPVKPYIRQWVQRVSGPNPPLVGQTTIASITIQVVNPTPHAITFSTTSSRLVSGFVPNNGSVTYGANASPTQGSVTAQPSVGGTGAITWNPGTVAGGTSAALEYQVRLRPASAGITFNVTGSPGANGTQAVFVDETGNTTQARATTTFGPICPLYATEGSGALLVDLVSFEAVVTGVNEPVLLRWETAAEFDNAGFNIYRAVEIGGGQYRAGEMLTETLIAPLGDETRGAVYEFADPEPIAAGETRAYFLEDVDVMGVSTLHGPVFAQAPERPAPPQPSPTPTVTPSSPQPEDSDNDGYADWYEKEVGTDPLDAASRPALGDVNGDGQITIEDAILLYRLAQSGDASLAPENLQRGDVNQDGRITLEDAIILYRWVLRAPDFPVLPHRGK